VNTDLDVFRMLEIKKLYFDILLFLLINLNHVLPVLKAFKELCQSNALDFALIRYFIGNIIEVIDPPYSNEFIELMKEILSISRVKDGLKNMEGVNEFLLQFEEENFMIE
jgi:negative elongation factor C/D